MPSSFVTFGKPTTAVNPRQGVQIDLLIQSRRTAYVIEIKRKNDISRSIISEVDEKVKALKRMKDVSIKTALVYAGQLAPIVEADGYFDAIIPIERILGLTE